MTSTSSSRTKVFISYSHKDARYLERLRVHLADYERNKLVETWDDTKIIPGATWRDEIEKAIDSAKVAVLLVSADFLASEFIAESELPRLLTAAQRGGTIILPVILSPCAFEYTKLSQFQAVNSLSMPLTKMNHHQREDLWAKVAKVIRDAKIADKSDSLASNYQQSLFDLQTLTQIALRTGTGTVLQSSEPDLQSSSRATSHKRVLETLSPGYFIFLLDQSASMSNPFGVAQTGFGKRKCDIVTTILNDFLNELITINSVAKSDGTMEVRPRAELTVLGYGDGEVHSLLSGALANKIFVILPELQMNPCDIELRKLKEIDETGMVFEIQVPFPIWVKPKAGGNAPMCAALQRARELAEQWVANHPNNYPPIVINITGGVASDGDPTQPGLRLCQVSTTDGQTLLYNVQISELIAPPVLYPSSEAELPNDQFTKLLFSLSSIIPENSRHLLETYIERLVPRGARGFIFNGDINSFRYMFVFNEIVNKFDSLASNYQQSFPDLQTLTQRELHTGPETILQPSDADVQGSLAATAYQRVLETLSPGYFIFLLDQSASMAMPFGVAQTDRSRRKCDMVATVLNDFLNELITINSVAKSDGTMEVRPRAELTVLGYGDGEVHSLLSGALANKVFVTLPELQMNPMDIELRGQKDIDDTGKEIEVRTPFPIWVKPKAGGNAPMCAALQRARELAEQWIANHPNNYPPIVINITGGVASDGDPTQPGLRLCQVSTTDGQTLLYNVQISELIAPPVLYPSSEAELPNDQFTKLLFSLSSIIPENSRSLIEGFIGRPMAPGARGFIIDGDVSSLRLMFHFADIEQPTFGAAERFELDDAMLHIEERLKVQDPDLKQGKVEVFTIQTAKGSIERPWGVQGGFAVVYKFRTKSGKMRALRFFRVPLPRDIQFRYERISAYFALHIPSITVAFKFYANGIVIKRNVQGHMQSRILPLIDMEWLEGVTLLEYVDELCQKRDRMGLTDLHKKFVTLVQLMHQAKVAHGSLSGTDIMVRTDGSLVLVDFDGVYIPDFANLPGLVLGQADYQHPQMHQRKFNEQMDNFSILVIQAALLVLQAQPDLWYQYALHNPQGKLQDINLLFKARDFLNPDQSNLMMTLEQISDPRVKAAVQALKQACLQSVDQVEFQLIQ